MECVVRKVKTKKGVEAAAEFRERWKHEIGIAIQCRKAAMLRAMLPRAQGRQAWLAGRGGHQEEGTLPPIEEEGEEPDEQSPRTSAL